MRIDGVNLQTMLRMQEHAPEAVEELLLEGGTVCVARLLEARAGGALAAVFTAAPLRAAAERTACCRPGRLLAALAQFAWRCSAYAFGPEALLAFLLRLELRRRGVRMSAALRKVLPAEEVKKRLEVYDG